MMNYKTNFLLIICLLMATLVHANNINIGNVTLTGRNTTAGVNHPDNYTMVRFFIQWENSWNSGSNWDAAWVFVKYRVGTGDWQHAKLHNTGHVTPSVDNQFDVGLLTPGSAFNAASNPGIGAFLRFSNVLSGANGGLMELRWNYGANGVQDNDMVDVRVYAIEMVYVPQGSFSVGDGTSDSRFCVANSTTGTVTFTIGATPPTLQGRNASSSASNLSAMGNSDFGTGTTTYS